jgi:3-deoxy-D-manno-octulosonic-acid transferase
MHLIYNFGIQLFILALKIASKRNAKARKWIEGRKGMLKIMKQEHAPGAKVIWVHCASLGEFEQGRPLIEEIKRCYPEKKIMLTFFSPSGFEVQKNYQLADYVYYLPADSPRNAKRFIRFSNPEVVFFIKYEYWLNYLTVLKKRKIPVYFVSSIFRKDQLFFKWYGGWYRKMLKLVTHFFLQNQESADLIESLGIKNFSIVGDTRFDRVAHIQENVKPIPEIERFLNGFKAVVAGSSWKAEEALLMQFHRQFPIHKLIVVPHEVNAENITRLIELFKDDAVCLSQMGTIKNTKLKKVLIVDSYGLLTSIYQYGYIGIIGGGFGAGIHNILEAATFGLPVIFGPKYHRFKEANDLVELKCAFPVNNIEEFNTLLMHLMKDPSVVKILSDRATHYIKSNIGATGKILNAVFHN